MHAAAVGCRQGVMHRAPGSHRGELLHHVSGLNSAQEPRWHAQTASLMV